MHPAPWLPAGIIGTKSHLISLGMCVQAQLLHMRQDVVLGGPVLAGLSIRLSSPHIMLHSGKTFNNLVYF